jgi:WD40 repeat protein
MVPISSPTASELIAMPYTRFNFNTPGPFRYLTSLLIFALAAPPSGYAQQPQPPQTPQRRILVEGESRTNTDKPAPSGPRAARPELVLQTGVTRPAYNAVFSPDERLLATIDRAAGSIKLWEIATGRELYAINLGARAANVNAMSSAFAFSSDGSSLFFFSAGTIKQWDTRSGRQIRATELTQGKDFFRPTLAATPGYWPRRRLKDRWSYGTSAQDESCKS